MEKKLICPQRLRKVPPQFSWVDQKLLREDHMLLCDTKSLAMYLFLIVVSDTEGLSYYKDSTICKYIKTNLADIVEARNILIRADLIAYKNPLYQVLEIPNLKDLFLFQNNTQNPKEGLVSIKDIFQRIGAIK